MTDSPSPTPSPDQPRSLAGPQDGVCVVVGATGAVGRTVVARLTGSGRRVLAVARDGDALAALAAESPAGLVTTCVADLSEDGVVATLRSAVAAVDRPVALGLFSAGLAVTGSLATIEPSALARACDVKVGGMTRMVHALDPHLVQGSRLVAVAGSLGLEPGPMDAGPGTVNAALLNLMRQLSKLYGPRGVVTSTLMLGPLDTPRLRAIAARRAAESGISEQEAYDGYRSATSLGALPTADEVAWLVETLLAPEAWLLHGAAICADGGVRHVIV